MLESGESTTTEDLQRAVDRLLDEGEDGAKIIEMVAERIPTHPVATPTDIVALLDHAETPPEDEGVVIYDELPPGLIDLPSAAKKYGVNNSTLRTWVNTGRIRLVARKKAPSAGGGYVAVSEAELLSYIERPRNKGGRRLNLQKQH